MGDAARSVSSRAVDVVSYRATRTVAHHRSQPASSAAEAIAANAVPRNDSFSIARSVRLNPVAIKILKPDGTLSAPPGLRIFMATGFSRTLRAIEKESFR